MPKARAGDPAKFFDSLLEFFDGGRRWTRGAYRDGRGRYCLIGAIWFLAGRHDANASDVRAALERELPRGYRGLMYFNDHCAGFAEVRALIEKARLRGPAYAEKEAQLWAAAERARRWLLDAIERERAAREAARDETPTSIIGSRAPVSERIAA